jgi:copper(I)-binding protein
MRKACSLLGAMAMLAGTAGCDDPPPVYVDGGYVRLNANPQAPSAGYFTIHAGADPVVLRDITTDEAVRLEIHESMTQGSMASMKKVAALDVPARGSVKLEPGGKHIMLWGVNRQAIADGKMTFSFIFSNGDRILVDAVVQKPDGSAANAGAGGNMADNAMANEHSGH